MTHDTKIVCSCTTILPPYRMDGTKEGTFMFYACPVCGQHFKLEEIHDIEFEIQQGIEHMEG